MDVCLIFVDTYFSLNCQHIRFTSKDQLNINWNGDAFFLVIPSHDTLNRDQLDDKVSKEHMHSCRTGCKLIWYQKQTLRVIFKWILG